MHLQDNAIKAYAATLAECDGRIVGQAQSHHTVSKSVAGGNVSITVIPERFDYNVSQDFHNLQLQMQDGKIAKSMLAREGGTFKYFTPIYDAAKFIPIVEDVLEVGYGKGEHSGARSDNSCESLHYNGVAHKLVTNRFVKTYPLETADKICVKEYIGTEGAKMLRTRRQNQLYGPMTDQEIEDAGENLKNRLVVKRLGNNQEQLAMNLQMGDVLSGEVTNIMEGPLKQLYHLAAKTNSSESVEYTLNKRESGVNIIVEKGSELYEIPYTTDAETIDSLIGLYNNFINVEGKHEVQATLGSTQTSFVVTSTDPNAPIQISPPRFEFAAANSTMTPSSEITIEILVPYVISDAPLVLPYRGPQVAEQLVSDLLMDWKTYVEYNDLIEDVLGDIVIHVSRQTAQLWQAGFAAVTKLGRMELTEAAAKLLAGKMQLEALAEHMGVAEIHVDPYLKGPIWWATTPQNFVVGINTGADDNFIEIEMGQKRDSYWCDRRKKNISLENHILVNTLNKYGCGFRRNGFVITNMCRNGCTPIPLHFKELDPDLANRKPIDSNVLVKQVA